MPRAPPTDLPKRTTRSSTSAAAAAALLTPLKPVAASPSPLPSSSQSASASSKLPVPSPANTPLPIISSITPNENSDSIVNTLRGSRRRAATVHPAEPSPPKRNRVSDSSPQQTQTASSAASKETHLQATTSIHMKATPSLSTPEMSAQVNDVVDPTLNVTSDRLVEQVTSPGGQLCDETSGSLSTVPVNTAASTSQAHSNGILESLTALVGDNSSGSSSLATTNAEPSATATTKGAAASRRLSKKKRQTPQQRQPRLQQIKDLQEEFNTSRDVESADSSSHMSCSSTITDPSIPSNNGKRRRDDNDDRDVKDKGGVVPSEEQKLDDDSRVASKGGHQEPSPSSSSSSIPPVLTTVVPCKATPKKKSRSPTKAQTVNSSPKKSTTRRPIAPATGSNSATNTQKKPPNRKQPARTGPKPAKTDAPTGAVPIAKTRKNEAKAHKATTSGTTTLHPKKKRRVQLEQRPLDEPRVGNGPSSTLNGRVQKSLSLRRPRRCPSTIDDSGSEGEGEHHQEQEGDGGGQVEEEELEEHQGQHYSQSGRLPPRDDNWDLWSRLAMDICFSCQIPKIKNGNGKYRSDDWAPDDIAAAVQLMMFSSSQLWTTQEGYDLGFWNGFWAGYPCNCFKRWTVRHGQGPFSRPWYTPTAHVAPYANYDARPTAPYHPAYTCPPGCSAREYSYSGSHSPHAGSFAHNHSFSGDQGPFAPFSCYPEPSCSAPMEPSATESASSVWQTLPPYKGSENRSSRHHAELPHISSVFGSSTPGNLAGSSPTCAPVPADPTVSSSDSIAPLI